MNKRQRKKLMKQTPPIDVHLFDEILTATFREALMKAVKLRLRSVADEADTSHLSEEQREAWMSLREHLEELVAQEIADQIFDSPVPTDHFQCASCQQIFEKGWSEQEAQAEREANGWKDLDCAVVCGDCYRMVMTHTDALLAAVPQEHGH
jgi:rubredoxin